MPADYYVDRAAKDPTGFLKNLPGWAVYRIVGAGSPLLPLPVSYSEDRALEEAVAAELNRMTEGSQNA